jgi:hypothetical protein
MVARTARGRRRHVIRAAEVVGSPTWGGEDLHTVLLMTSTTAHSIRVLAPTDIPAL